MLIVFHSKAAADVLMFSAHALVVMQVVGRNYADGLPERGVITAEQLPAAIAALEKAIATDAEKEKAMAHEAYEDDDEAVHPISEPVSFRQRAWPLLSMFKASNEAKVDILWEPAPKW